jgi:hypothetical protein
MIILRGSSDESGRPNAGIFLNVMELFNNHTIALKEIS